MQLSGPLKDLARGRTQIELKPVNDLTNLVLELDKEVPGTRASVLDKRKNIRGSIIVFVNREILRGDRRGRTELYDGDVVTIVPGVAGA